MHSLHHFILLFLIATIFLVSSVFSAPVNTKDLSVPVGVPYVDVNTLRLAPAVSKITVRGLNSTTDAVTDGVTCETTFASPTYSEIEEVKKLVVNAKTWCAQGNPGGSKCTTHASYKGGQLALCGSSNKSMKCEDLAWAAGQIRDQCGDKNLQRAGGYWVFSNGMKAVLY